MGSPVYLLERDARRTAASAGLEDERQLLDRCQRGDRTAFGQIVKSYQTKVFNLVLRIIHDRHAAEDVTQEAFLRAYRKIGHFDPERRFLPWIYQIAINLSRNYLKASGRREFSGLEEMLSDMPADGHNQESNLVQKQLAVGLEKALASIPEKYRTPLILKHVEGMNYQEIARVLRLPTWVLKMRVCRARSRLRIVLGGAKAVKGNSKR